jgi:shikimate kinase/3-dehydroquinate synthase
VIGRGLALAGPMGVGKSTVGAAVARRLGVPYIDLDAEVIAATGRPLHGLFQVGGEAGFRAAERAALDRALAGPAAVLALGGGAAHQPGAVARIRSAGWTIVRLTAPDSLLEARIADDEARPLRAQAAALRAARADGERLLGPAVEVGGLDPDAAAGAVLAVLGGEGRGGEWSMEATHGDHRYPVMVSPDGALGLGPALAAAWPGGPPGRRVRVVCAPPVADLHLADALRGLTAAGFAPRAVLVPDGEAHKTLGAWARLVQDLLASGVDRSTPVIGLGGGVVGDLAGFAAATLLRGVPYVAAPTSLLAVVDAALGGKTGVDVELPGGALGKNLVGVIAPPLLVFAGLGCLGTLPEREWRSGLGEVLKHAIIGDAALFGWLEANAGALRRRAPEAVAHAVRACVQIKARVVASDPGERGPRRALNFGHTVGHAIEAVSRGALSHGDCVSLGMGAELRALRDLGWGAPGLPERCAALTEDLGLPLTAPDLDRDALLAAACQDKKVSHGMVRLVAPWDIGDARPVALAPAPAGVGAGPGPTAGGASAAEGPTLFARSPRGPLAELLEHL